MKLTEALRKCYDDNFESLDILKDILKKKRVKFKSNGDFEIVVLKKKKEDIKKYIESSKYMTLDSFSMFFKTTELGGDVYIRQKYDKE